MMPAEHVISAIAARHVEEAAFLWVHRETMLSSARVTLRDLASYDERIAAHLDGLRVEMEAGSDAIPQLGDDDTGALFAPAVLALEFKDTERLEALISRATATPQLAAGLIGALGWVSARFLQGTAKELLAHTSPFHRALAIRCCAMHGVDPGISLDSAVHDSDVSLRSQALRAVGELARARLMSACMAGIRDVDPRCRLFAARSAVLLGDRNRALEALVQIVLEAGSYPEEALLAALTALDTRAAPQVLQQMSGRHEAIRLLVRGSGLVGDPLYVPWLIKQMAKPELARLAAEAFTTITGADLARADLEGERPPGVETGPTDDAADTNVDMDPDGWLPWPRSERVEQWWVANGSRFTPGTRYFMGAPVTRAHCIDVLKNGRQPQRTLAAHYLCVLDPGTPLFNTSAPAWRQQRLLAKM